MPVTRYVVKRKADGYFYAVNQTWTFAPIGALWFESLTAATTRASRDQLGSRDTWEAVAVEA